MAETMTAAGMTAAGAASENKRPYTTQMDAARKGIVTKEIRKVAEKEYMTTENLMKLVAEGKVAIPANRLHKSLNPEGVGSMLRTKINVNLGVSRDCKDYNIEMEKVMSAVNMGAEAIMDLSSHGNTQPFRQKLTRLLIPAGQGFHNALHGIVDKHFSLFINPSVFE